MDYTSRRSKREKKTLNVVSFSTLYGLKILFGSGREGKSEGGGELLL